MENGQITEKFLRLLMESDNRIYAFILSLVPNRTDADDIMQETIIVMWRKFREFSASGDAPENEFTAWGIVIARNKVFEYRKQGKKFHTTFNEGLLEVLERETGPTLSDIDLRIEYLQKCVNRLSGSDRQLLYLRYQKNQTLKEIAGNVSRSLQSVNRTLVRIQTLLLRCVSRSMAEDAAR